MASKFVLVPRAYGLFNGIDPLARMCFGYLWDRFQLSEISAHSGRARFALTLPTSMFERYGGAHVATYCVYSASELALEIGCTDRTVRRCISDLRNAGLIDTHRRGYMGKLCFTFPKVVRDALPSELKRQVLGVNAE